MIKNVLLCILFSANFLIAEVIIDVRTSKEFQSGHLEKSINIEWQDILSISGNIEKSKRYIYIVAAVIDRKKATEILSQAGFLNVENLGSITQASEKLKVKIIKKI